jgi:uncharacterized protein (DUF58 family)
MPDYRKYLNPEVLTRISRLELRARLIVEGFIAGMHRSPYHGFSVEFASHREYAPGDDLRHIDWRLYARGDRLYIKQYEEETNLPAYVLLDCSRSMLYPEQTDSKHMNKYDYACTLAASLIYLLMTQQDACGLALFDQDIREQLPATSSTGRLRSMIELIASHQPDHGTDTQTLFSQIAPRLQQRGLVILISDLLTDVDELVKGLQRLRYTRHDVIVLHVLDHDELNFPFDDNTLFEGLETPGNELLADPQALRDSYLRIMHEYIRKVRTACANQRVDYQLLSTHDSLDAGLSAFLAARMHRSASGSGPHIQSGRRGN